MGTKFISDLKSLRALNRRRKEEYREWRENKRMIEKTTGGSTLTIGNKARDGVILASDRKSIRDGEADFEDKIRVFNITESGSPIVLATAGYLGVTEDFLRKEEDSMEPNNRVR